ncbi:hypothetical protein B481_3215 [Planococcus halocryophilus Or1]|nr:hypothetical protein B481_3215 [Planococcus halocryophilus Or1]
MTPAVVEEKINKSKAALWRLRGSATMWACSEARKISLAFLVSSEGN